MLPCVFLCLGAQVEVPGVENINLSRLIAGHQDYLVAMEDILEAINMHDT
jgi:hypothetical protein